MILAVFGVIMAIACWILTIGYICLGPEEIGVDKADFRYEVVYRILMSTVVSVMWLWLLIERIN